MRKLEIPANALAVALGATLLFSYGTVSSLISSSGSASKKGDQVRPTLTGKTNLAQSPAIRQ